MSLIALLKDSRVLKPTEPFTIITGKSLAGLGNSDEVQLSTFLLLLAQDAFRDNVESFKLRLPQTTQHGVSVTSRDHLSGKRSLEAFGDMVLGNLFTIQLMKAS